MQASLKQETKHPEDVSFVIPHTIYTGFPVTAFHEHLQNASNYVSVAKVHKTQGNPESD